MKERKETKVDDVLHTMIRSHNYSQISEFISPLASLTDQVKKAKFESYRNEICVSLEEVIHGANRLLNAETSLEQTAHDVKNKFGVVMDAKDELRGLLYPRLDLKNELNILINTANGILNRFCIEMLDAIKSSNFILLLSTKRKACTFYDDLRKYLSERIVKAFESAQQNANAKLEAVPTYVDSFFKTLFKDATTLDAALKGLKDSKLLQDKHLEILHELYDNTVKDIDQI